jgi:hypothetical protein
MKSATFKALITSMKEALEHADGERALRMTTLQRSPARHADAVDSPSADVGSTSTGQTRTALDDRSSATRAQHGTDSD